MVLAALARSLMHVGDSGPRRTRPGGRWRRPAPPGQKTWRPRPSAPSEGRAPTCIPARLAWTPAGRLAAGARHRRHAHRPDVLRQPVGRAGIPGGYDEAAQTAADGLDLARRLGLTRSEGPYLLSNQAESLLHLGRWAEVDRLLTLGLSVMPEGVVAGFLEMMRAELAAMRGRLDEAAPALRASRRTVGDTTDLQFLQPMGYIGALIALGLGDRPAARRNRGWAGGRVGLLGVAVRLAPAVAGNADRSRRGAGRDGGTSPRQPAALDDSRAREGLSAPTGHRRLPGLTAAEQAGRRDDGPALVGGAAAWRARRAFRWLMRCCGWPRRHGRR